MHTSNGNEPVSKRLKRLRLQRGLSQRDLSSPGVSYAYISRIEAGARTPSVKALRKLSEKLGVTVEYLETGQDASLVDDLIGELWSRTQSTVRISISPERAFVRWRRDGDPIDVDGRYLTEALLAAVRLERERDELRETAQEAEARERRLVGSRYLRER